MNKKIALQKEYEEICQLAEDRLKLKQKLKNSKINKPQIEEQILDIEVKIRNISHYFMVDERGEVDITLEWVFGN